MTTYRLSSHEVDHINRVGFEYQGDYSERSWAHTTFGYRVENENGFVGISTTAPQTHGQRLQSGRLRAAGVQLSDGCRNNCRRPLRPRQRFRQYGRSARRADSSGAATANEVFSGTRLRFSYATGFKEPRLEETFNGIPPIRSTLPNPDLKPERVRAFEAGFQQEFFGSKYEFTATYFNNLFHDQINYVEVDPVTLHRAVHQRQPVLCAGSGNRVAGEDFGRGFCSTPPTRTRPRNIWTTLRRSIPIFIRGQPLLRRPKHSGSHAAFLSRQPLGSESGRKLCRPAQRLRFPRLGIRSCCRLCTSRSRRMVRDYFPRHRIRQYRKCFRQELQRGRGISGAADQFSRGVAFPDRRRIERPSAPG